MHASDSPKMRFRLAWLGTFAIALLLTASAGASELASGTLSVERSAEAGDCPDDTALASSTLALGTPPPVSTEPLEVSVEFTRDATGYAAVIRTRGRKDGVREVHKQGDSCAPLAEAVSVVLALVFDLLPPEPALAAPAPTVLAPEPEKERQRAPEQLEVTAPPPPAPSASPFTLGVGIHGAASYGLLGDAVVAAATLAVRPRFGRWEISAGGLWAPNRTVGYLGRSVYVSLLTGRLGACGWARGSLSEPDVGFCAGTLLGSLRGRGEGFDDDATASDLWFALEAGVAGRLPLAGKWALRLGISAVVPSRRQQFSVSGSGVAFRTTSAAGLVELGPELAFP